MQQVNPFAGMAKALAGEASLLIAIRDIADYLGVCVRHARRLVKRPDSPNAIRVSNRVVRWKARDVIRWLRSLPESTHEDGRA